jgi:hypothetical protein
MRKGEVFADWVSYGADRALDALSLVTGKAGKAIKNTYTGSKYFLSQAVGDVFGAGLTAKGIAAGARDAAVELGVGYVQDRALGRLANRWSIFKDSRVPEGIDLSGSSVLFKTGRSAFTAVENLTKAEAYKQALIGTAGRGTFWNFVGDRYKNVLKGNPMKQSTNAYESYVLRLPTD